jgi:F-type H+-transporting ATPase subunit a
MIHTSTARATGREQRRRDVSAGQRTAFARFLASEATSILLLTSGASINYTVFFRPASLHRTDTTREPEASGCDNKAPLKKTKSVPEKRRMPNVTFRRWLLIIAVFTTLGAGYVYGAGPEQQEHGLPQQAVEIARPLGFPITNSMVVTWIVAVGLIVFARVATRDMKHVPDGAQNLFEWLVESLYGFLEGIIGPHLVKRTFWFFATIFIFILSANWIGLIPGVGTIGWGHQTAHGFKIDDPWLRGANADLNLTLAMALIFFACWIVWALREVGPVGFVKELFAPKGESTGVLKVLMVAVFFGVGCLELISILFRPVSLSFRLYGNIFAGENMLESMSTLVPGLGWLLPVPFYFMELLVGLVQALVFMLLTAVFTLLICQHEEQSPAAAPETET